MVLGEDPDFAFAAGGHEALIRGLAARWRCPPSTVIRQDPEIVFAILESERIAGLLDGRPIKARGDPEIDPDSALFWAVRDELGEMGRALGLAWVGRQGKNRQLRLGGWK